MTHHLLTALLLAGCTSQGGDVTRDLSAKDGHDGHLAAPAVPASPPHTTSTPALPRPVPTRASRSRVATPAPTGTLLDVTCYSPTGNRTASGKWPHVGMAASNSHPFGTRLLVEGIGVLTVEDRIGHGTDLDVFRTSETECIRFGRQHLRVAVVQ